MASNGQRPHFISFVLYPHLTVFDLTGPLQVVSALARRRSEFQPVVVAERREPVVTDIGIPMIPSATFEDVPRPYVVVVPGGDVGTYRAMHDPAVRRYIRTAAESAEIVMSICTGAIILASLGLLENQRATTHWAFHNTLKQFGATYERKRWIEAPEPGGKFLCTAGVSAGIDGALELVARLTDEKTARQVQLDMHYDPQPPFGAIDWENMPFNGRLTRALFSAAAPLIAFRARRLLSQGR